MNDEFFGPPVDPIIRTVSWLEGYGVELCVVDLGAADTETDEVVFEKKPRLLLHNVPPFVISPGEWACVRKYEDEVIEYLKERVGNNDT